MKASERARAGTLVGVAAVLAAALGACTAPQPEVEYTLAEWRFGGRPGYVVTTPHYTIYTTVTDERLARTFPLLVEQAFAQYEALLPASEPPTGRMPMYLFKSRGEWAWFTQRTFPDRAPLLLKIRWGGYSEQGIAAMEYVSHAQTFPLLAHEGLHQYVHHYITRKMPAWLNEGLAVCCEGQRWSGDDEVTFDPYDNTSRRNRLAEMYLAQRLIPLEQLLRTHAGEVMDGPPSQIHSYYAQVWALVLFLRDGQDGKYRPDFDRLLEAMRNDDGVRHARAAYIRASVGEFNYGEHLFRAFFGHDLPAIEQEYHNWIREVLIEQG